MNKNLVIILVIAVIVGSYFIYGLLAPEYNVRTFAGRLIGYEGSALTLNGVFESESGPLPDSLQDEQDFTFRVGDTTIFEKEIITWPGVDVKEQRQKSAGSLEDLKSLFGNAVYIKATFSVSIHKRDDRVVASHIIYRAFAVPPYSPAIPSQ